MGANLAINWSRPTQVIVAAAAWVTLAFVATAPGIANRIHNSRQWRAFCAASPWIPTSYKNKVLESTLSRPSEGDLPILEGLVRGSTGVLRDRAAIALSRFPNESTTRVFLEVSDSPEHVTRGAALNYLSRYGDERAAPLFLSILRSSYPAVNFGSEAAAALARLGDKRALPLIMGLLDKPRAPDALTGFEVSLTSFGARMAGISVDLRPRCAGGIGKKAISLEPNLEFMRIRMMLELHPERAAENDSELASYDLKVKRRVCENQNQVQARSTLMKWWTANKRKFDG